MTNENPLILAHQMADAAGTIARQYFGSSLDIITKDDASPVTIADRAIEQKLRDMVGSARPDDGILGEEFAPKETRNGYTWVFDPIDGTKSFTIGRPTFGTLIALCYNGVPIVGVIDQPILGHRWVGQKDKATTYNGKDVICRPCPTMSHAIIGTGGPSQIGVDVHSRLEKQARYMVYQGDCYFYGLMANGLIDGLIENNLGPYDYLALVPIIEGAGGIITDWHGRPKTLDGDPSLLAAGSKNIHADIMGLIAG